MIICAWSRSCSFFWGDDRYTLCTPGPDGTCCLDPEVPTRGQVVVEYNVRGRDMVYSLKDDKCVSLSLSLAHSLTL
jgi:hypothetical protein